MNRRDFVKLSGTMAASALMISPEQLLLETKNKNKGIGIQLYTVRNEMSKDVQGTLKKVAHVGYTFIENAGYHNGTFYSMPKTDFKKVIDDLGLKMVSGHVSPGSSSGDKVMGLTYKFEQVCEDAVAVGQKYLGTGWMGPEFRTTIDDYKWFAEMLNKGGEIANKFNLKFFHHNHDFEFNPINGMVPYDILLSETDKKLVSFELDHYWTRKAGIDSIKLMNDHPGRFPLWHIKDMDNTPKQAFTEVGTGVIDYQKVFKQKKVSGMEFYFVEQDSCVTNPPLKSMEISYNNLKKIKR